CKWSLASPMRRSYRIGTSVIGMPFSAHSANRSASSSNPVAVRPSDLSRSETNPHMPLQTSEIDRKSTRLNSSHQIISYAVFCFHVSLSALYPLSLPDALPILQMELGFADAAVVSDRNLRDRDAFQRALGEQVRLEFESGRGQAERLEPIGNESPHAAADVGDRSEEHTSELQSPDHLVCRLLLPCVAIRAVPSLPTRRSSDLANGAWLRRCGGRIGSEPP